MLRFVVFIVILNSLFITLYARMGVDLSIFLTVNNWRTMFPSPATNRNFAIIHGQFYNNTVNIPGLNAIASAWTAGVVDLSLYFYPCHPSSVYVSSTSTLCPSATEQLNSLITTLNSRGIAFFNVSSFLPENATAMQNNPYNYPNVWNATSPKIILNRLFINLEDTTPNQYFSLNHYENVDFLNEFVNATQAMGIELGVYTTVLDWNNIMTEVVEKRRVYYLSKNTFTEVNPFSFLKLWTPRYDQLQDMSFFAAFAGWNSTFIKQTSGGAKENRRIGGERICSDYMV